MQISLSQIKPLTDDKTASNEQLLSDSDYTIFTNLWPTWNVGDYIFFLLFLRIGVIRPQPGGDGGLGISLVLYISWWPLVSRGFLVFPFSLFFLFTHLVTCIFFSFLFSFSWCANVCTFAFLCRLFWFGTWPGSPVSFPSVAVTRRIGLLSPTVTSLSMPPYFFPDTWGLWVFMQRSGWSLSSTSVTVTQAVLETIFWLLPSPVTFLRLPYDPFPYIWRVWVII